jgi:hypothetical protein
MPFLSDFGSGSLPLWPETPILLYCPFKPRNKVFVFHRRFTHEGYLLRIFNKFLNKIKKHPYVF